MDRYLVGGAVRDELLGRTVSDRDWVVVGATPAQMLAAGFRPVGRDFPVFLHPDTREEHALARTERKSGPGYRGFVVNSDPSVTLEEDLERRDLTINAMARTPAGQLIDPFGGERDLSRRVLRHVSPAFAEDPVRVLRVARFMARLSARGFRLAPATLECMQKMVDSGELAHLVPERCWQELAGALEAERPRAFIETLRAAGALAVVFPEIDALFGVPQPLTNHPEGDSGLHTLLVLDQATGLDAALDTRFAALCHDLGKARTPRALWPKHHGHERRGAEIARALCDRLKAPRRTREHAVLAARYHTHCHRIDVLNAKTTARLIEALDIARRPERLDVFLNVCTADARGRYGFADTAYPQAARLRELADAWLSIDAAAIARRGTDAAGIATAIRDARMAALISAKRLQKQHRNGCD